MDKLSHSNEMNSIIKELCEAVETKETMNIIDVHHIVLKHKTIADALFATSRSIMIIAMKEGYFVKVPHKVVQDGHRLRSTYMRTSKEFELVYIKYTNTTETEIKHSNEAGLELFALFGIKKPDTMDLKKVKSSVVSQWRAN